VISIGANATQEEVLEAAKASADISRYLTGQIKKVIFVPKKILNIIVG
jgi:leucyl-tRNA synthetase